MSELEDKKTKIKARLVKFFDNRLNLVLVLILVFAALVRIRYLLIDQAVWWDAADYLTFAKIIGGKLVNYAAYDFNPRRPFFLAFLWGMFYRLGLNEIALRFTEFLFSFGVVILTYLLGKELYNKKVGLIASLIISSSYLYLFFTARLMTDIPCVFFLMLTMLMFWKGFIKNQGMVYAILTGVFAGIAILTRAASIFTFPLFIVFVFIIKRFKILKNKKVWVAVVISLLVFSPFLIFIHFQHGGDAIGKFLGINYGRFTKIREKAMFNVLFQNVDHLPLYLDANERVTSMLANNVFWDNFGLNDFIRIPFLILFLVGLIFLIGELVLGFDIILKNKNKILRSNLFVVLWFLIPFIAISLNAGFEPRQVLITFPAAFIIVALMLMKIYKFILKYNKYIALAVVGVILISGVYAQASYGHNLIKSKRLSYYPVKQAGLWIKENSDVDDIIISASIYQNMYYAERDTYGFYRHFGDRGRMDEDEFTEFLKKTKPKYLVMSIFEPGFTSDWAYVYADKHENLKPVMGYKMSPNDEQPALIIYEFSSY